MTGIRMYVIIYNRKLWAGMLGLDSGAPIPQGDEQTRHTQRAGAARQEEIDP